MADEQRALMAMSTVLLFEELFDRMIEQEVQEMGNSDSDDALLLAVLAVLVTLICGSKTVHLLLPRWRTSA